MEKLCSLQTIGALSASEKRELDAHLGECSECRTSVEDFERLAFVDLPAIAIRRTLEDASSDAYLPNPEIMLSRILDQESVSPRQPVQVAQPTKISNDVIYRPSWTTRAYGFFSRPLALGWAVVIMAACTGGYFASNHKAHIQPAPGAHLQDQSSALEKMKSVEAAWKARAEQAETEAGSAAKTLDRAMAQKAEALETLTSLRASLKASEEKQALLEQQLADESAKSAEKESDLQATRASLDEQRQQVKALNVELQNANAGALEARERIAHLSQVSEKVSQRSIAPSPQFSDSEARQVFGARDLHIVDVYDVDRSGKTRRTYGRVYYVNRSLLLFYAFDLEDRKNNRKAAGFQAWGFREPNSSKPENLGLFYVDDASLNRWVLKVSDANVLSRIDTVFVTLEPPQGSESPLGPKLLFASLGGPANHP